MSIFDGIDTGAIILLIGAVTIVAVLAFVGAAEIVFQLIQRADRARRGKHIARHR